MLNDVQMFEMVFNEFEYVIKWDVNVDPQGPFGGNILSKRSLSSPAGAFFLEYFVKRVTKSSRRGLFPLGLY